MLLLKLQSVGTVSSRDHFENTFCAVFTNILLTRERMESNYLYNVRERHS
jgi:hypothetical protein